MPAAGTAAYNALAAGNGGNTTQGGQNTSTTTLGSPAGSNTAVSGGASGGQSAALQSTGDPNLDQLQAGFQDYITGSLASGFQINPGLSITPDVIAGFVSSTVSQLDPKYTQNLESTINDVNVNLNKMAVDYTNTRGQTVQDYQQSLGKLRDQTSFGGGGERALELGLTNSANRSLSSLDTDTAAAFSKELNAGGAAVGQGINGGNVFGTTVPGLSGTVSGAYGASAGGLNQGSFVIPSLYGLTLSNQGGDAIFAGSSNTGNALNYSYNPSMYQYGSIPSSYASDFLGQLNQSAKNYQAGQIATGGTNIKSSSGLTL